MSECRDKVYFGYAERRGNGGEASNGWPEAGVVTSTLRRSRTFKGIGGVTFNAIMSLSYCLTPCKNFANKAEASEKSCIFAAESCRSGRTGQTRNLLNPSGFRGFESLTFRNKKQGDKPCFFVSIPLADACVRKKV